MYFIIFEEKDRSNTERGLSYRSFIILKRKKKKKKKKQGQKIYVPTNFNKCFAHFVSYYKFIDYRTNGVNALSLSTLFTNSSFFIFWRLSVNPQSNRARGYKTFFMFSSVELEMLNAYKYENIKVICLIFGSDKLRMLVFPLINVQQFMSYKFFSC